MFVLKKIPFLLGT